MHTLKDKVSQKLSNLFADSPSQSASPRFSNSDSPKARLSSSVGKSLSSYFSFVVPQSGNDDDDLESCPPLPIRTDSYESIENCKPEHGQDKAGTFVSNGEDKDSDKGRELRVSAKVESGSDYLEGVKQMRELTESSVFITANLCEFLQACLPNIVRGCKWFLLYSTLKHGISLRTLLRRSGELPGPCLLVAGDKQGAVFGALLECPLRPTPKRKYQGTSQTFLFTTIYGEPRIFRPTGANRYYLMCMNEFLAFGGGGNFALCLGEDLLKATSGPSETFGNECLASSTEFELKNVELWGFAHASQYLSS
ncbi:PREDICTED: oxidation resistance protein 1 [Camelina sativa]|uniref:Oxidation resistance protein 1 n=1 Tax=Camelina sativa TaxID=90675 RepID=A0ABM0SKX7_CAMSA|nr:PREDICTED: oxidation resistance protein 1 [Camelina sativa]